MSEWLCRAASLIAVAAIHVGCDGKLPPAPTPGTAANLHRIEIEVPASFPSDRTFLPGEPSSPALVLAPGASVQLTVRGYLRDGSSRDVTREAKWRSGNRRGIGVVGVADGLVQAGQPGTAWVSVDVGSLQTVKEVLVTPDGTFALRGYVRDARTGQPMSGATVAVVNGPLPGTQWHTTNVDGFYVLWSVPPLADISAGKPGFTAPAQRVSLGDHNARVDFLLDEETPLVRLAGTYTLVITADAGCSIQGGAFPDSLRTRTYTAIVTQTGNELTVVLSGATFHPNSGGRFSGRLSPGLATFQLIGYYWMAPLDGDVVEQISPSTILTIEGYATMLTSNLSGRLDGQLVFETVENHETGQVSDRSICASQNHQFRMSRSGV